MTTISFELEKFLDTLDMLDDIYIVMPGAVISGHYLKMADQQKTIDLSNAVVHTGGNITEVQDVSIPKDKVMAWGFKEDQE